MNDRKALIRAFKEKIPPKGVFCIKNNESGRIFLASSLNLHGIFSTQKMALNNNIHMNGDLQSDWNTFGAEAFTFEILEEMKFKEDGTTNYIEELEILEAIWVDKFEPIAEKTYNKSAKIRTV